MFKCAILSEIHLNILMIIYFASSQILYTMGTVDNLDKSRSNFAQALRLDNNNMRALYGFFMVGIQGLIYNHHSNLSMK
jgi:hypothetical protein